MKQNSVYHSALRVSAFVCAVALVFESGLISESTAVMSRDTHSYLANAVGASASVQPTELNKITAALTAQKNDLNAREASLIEREIEIDLSAASDSSDTATYILSSILTILLLLILLNYALDYLRSRDRQRAMPV